MYNRDNNRNNKFVIDCSCETREKARELVKLLKKSKYHKNFKFKIADIVTVFDGKRYFDSEQCHKFPHTS